MLSRFVEEGSKVELRALEHGLGESGAENTTKVYQSRVLQILSEDTLEISMPMEQTRLILLPVESEYDMVFFEENSLYQCFSRIVDRYKSNNVYVLVMELTSNLRKYQRREYYRFSCALDMCARNLEEEEIKALGYRWTAVDASQMAYMHKPDMGWVKVVPYEHLEEEKEKAFAIGAKEAEVSDRELANQKERYQEMLSEQRIYKRNLRKKAPQDTSENREKQQMYEEKLRSLCPVEPDVIRGKYWNEKVYGKAGRYSIYPDSRKLEISDEEAAALKKYLSDRAEYRKTKKEMEEEGFVVPAWA